MFDALATNAAEAKRERVALARFAARWANRPAAMAMAAWITFVEEQHQSRRLMTGVLRRLCTGKLGSAYNSWRAFVATEKLEETRRRKFAWFRNKLLRGSEARALEAWRFYVTERQRIRALVWRVLSRLSNGKLGASFTSWIAYSHAMREEEHKQVVLQR